MAFSIKHFIPFFNPESDQISDVNYSNTQKIVELFHFLEAEKTVLNAKLPDGKREYTSSILNVDDKKKQFTLDEIYPFDGNKLFKQYGRIIINTRIHGASLSFETYMISSESSKQFSSYTCHLPELISYFQRRADFRIPIKPPLLVQVTAQHKATNQVLQGFARDMSINGICIQFKTPHLIKPGEQLVNCKLAISSKESLNFTMDVRHIESTAPGSIGVGGSFRDLDARSRDTVSRFVRHLERTSIKL